MTVTLEFATQSVASYRALGLILVFLLLKVLQNLPIPVVGCVLDLLFLHSLILFCNNMPNVTLKRHKYSYTRARMEHQNLQASYRQYWGGETSQQISDVLRVENRNATYWRHIVPISLLTACRQLVKGLLPEMYRVNSRA